MYCTTLALFFFAACLTLGRNAERKNSPLPEAVVVNLETGRITILLGKEFGGPAIVPIKKFLQRKRSEKDTRNRLPMFWAPDRYELLKSIAMRERLHGKY